MQHFLLFYILYLQEHFYYDMSTNDHVSIVPSLGDTYTKMYNGAVGIFNKGGDGELVSVIEVAKLLGEEGHQHPHVSCTYVHNLLTN